MAEPKFSSGETMGPNDDLPRTLRREREAQARRAREQELELSDRADRAAGGGDGPSFEAPAFEDERYEYDDIDPAPATVTRLDIPFLHLMVFFLKAVIAGIPALILLLAILWLCGEILTATFPELIKMQVLIRMPN